MRIRANHETTAMHLVFLSEALMHTDCHVRFAMNSLIGVLIIPETIFTFYPPGVKPNGARKTN